MPGPVRFRWSIAALGWIAAVVATIVITVVLRLLKADAAVAGISYLVFVVWFATQAPPAISICQALASALCFDYFFLEPLYSFNLSGAQSWVTMTAFAAACLVVSRVAERARRQALTAEARREDVERLYTLSQEMMLHDDVRALVREIPQLVERVFSLTEVRLYIAEENQSYSSVPGESGSAAKVAAASVSVELSLGMKSIGSMAWSPDLLSPEVATAVAAQVAIAITRAHAIEASGRLEAARSADRLRTAMIDSMTHELRTPLTAIRAAATTLLDGHGLDDESRTELATIVDEESTRLDHLIGEAMEMAEIDSNGIRVRAEQVHLESLLEQAVEEMRPQLASHKVSIEMGKGNQPVWLDPRLIGRVLHHLLENAARYTKPGSGIRLVSGEASERIEIRVEDDGPGIDPRDLPLIFDRFYRGKVRPNVGKGSGMGLAIVRSILIAHGGGIEVKSAPGVGTVFTVWLPPAPGLKP